MLPKDIRLFTWVDVEEVLLRAAEQDGGWLPQVIRADAYWDTLSLHIQRDTESEVIEWLKELFSPRFDEENGIILESVDECPRHCQVSIEVEESQMIGRHFLPTFSRPKVICEPGQKKADPLPFNDNEPPLVACHSFKGGVGRTLHALALARAIERDGGSVLLVDGDLEAPGISWLLERRLPDPPVSYSDFLALAQSSVDPQYSDAVELVARRLQNSQIGNIYVLPSFRNKNRWNTLEIRPEHLLNREHPFIIANLMVRLGQKLGVDAVIVDLRAGLTELSSGLILDPRAHRVFVTSASGQSIMGACEVFRLVSQYAPSYKDYHPEPSAIISLLPKELEDIPEVSGELKLRDAAEQLIIKDGEDDVEMNISFSPYQQNLLVMDPDWEKAFAQIDQSNLRDSVRSILDSLNIEKKKKVAASPGVNDLSTRREKLKILTDGLEYAESGEGEIFLKTAPLRHLAENHLADLPHAILIGAKGAGKTYTFLQLAKVKSWNTFVDDFSSKPYIGLPEVVFFPFLQPKNLQKKAKEILKEAEDQVSGERMNLSLLRDEINNNLYAEKPLTESEWRNLWLDLIAWRLGAPKEKGVGADFPKKLAQTKKSVVLLVDGLEDLFQNINTNQQQQTALRVLLQDVPEWLSQFPVKSLGILVFVRQDLVSYAIKQNLGQLLDLHKPYVLEWHETEALKLAASIAIQAESLDAPSEDLHAWDFDQLNRFLAGLWGLKLGTAKSREARSSRWILDVLSDLRQQLQARDLVRLLKESAARSLKDKSDAYNDRLLTPASIRGSIDECSKKKIAEVRDENPQLNGVFGKILGIPVDKKVLPFRPDDLGLEPEDVGILEKNGVVLLDGSGLLMPEIFRRGLGFSYSAPGRVKVRSLKRSAQRNARNSS